MKKIIALFLSLSALIFPKLTFAAEGADLSEYSHLEEQIASLSFQAVLIASILLVILTVISLKVKKQKNWLKSTLFGSYVAVSLLTTFFLAGATIYLNTISISNGPVHWHADMEIWVCGTEVDLKNPTGFSNKIGTPSLHEHNDKRIHLEGVQVEPSDASLGKFFKVIGGSISPDSITYPTDQGMVTLNSSSGCNPGETDAKLQVFVYRVFGKKAIQEKLGIDPAKYIITGESQVPPGDCIIIEFDKEKDRTEKECRSFKVAKEIGKLDK